MKDIKEYLHLYMGCEVQYKLRNITAWQKAHLVTVSNFGSYVIETKDAQFSIELEQWDLKPILRKLSSMTEADSIKVFGVKNKADLFLKEEKLLPPGDRWLFTANEFTTLLTLGFDLFGLIDSGLAIEKQSLIPPYD